MGVAPEATIEYLYLAVGSSFGTFEQLHVLVIHIILLSKVWMIFLIRVAHEHLNKLLYLIIGSRSFFVGTVDLFLSLFLMKPVEISFYDDIIADDGHDPCIGKPRLM
jgi:hypothetical protein